MQKIVLITGAARRIGAVCCRLLHQQGFNMILHYRSSGDDARNLCAELNDLRPDSAVALSGNLLDIQAIDALTKEAVAVWGKLDVLVNNASSFYPTPLDTVTENAWEDLLGTNLKAPFFLAKALLPELRRRHGCIVNIADIHAERGLEGYPVYSIAKAGLVAMTKVLAKECGPEVRVNTISPGAILWPEHDSSEAEQKSIIEKIPLGHCGKPEDIARALKFLIQDAGYITGQEIKVDGGRTLFC
ncbi:MAG: pteridine reductase [Methylomicrobium sp.]|nr:pteridine reductase [Methylomicrobium sp.]